VHRTWLAVPIAGVACAAIALASRSPGEAAAIGLTGAALAAAVRAFAGPSAAAAAAAVIGALIGGLALLELPGLLVRAPLACAAAAFAIGELVRPAPPGASPWPAVGAAVVAAVLDPSFTVLIAISGWKATRTAWARYVLAVPAAGVLATALAANAALYWPHLWATWSGHAPHAPDPVHAAGLIGDALGPIAAVAALAGIAIAAARGRYALVSILGVVAASVAVSIRADALGAAALAIGALGCGVAIARLASLVRIPSGQVIIGVTAGLLVLALPALALHG
jgi:hypothetical protein